MFIPARNNYFILKCKICKTDVIGDDICDECKSKYPNGGLPEKPKTDGIFGEEILLPVYYKRKIELTFVREESVDIHYEYIYNYTAMMLPNKERWLDEKIAEAKNKIEMTGLKEIEVKMTGEFEEMCDEEVSYFSSLKNSEIDCGYGMMMHSIEVPLVLYASNHLGDVNIKLKTFRAIYTHVIKKWRWAIVPDIILTVIASTMMIILLISGAVSLAFFVHEITIGHYSHSIGPFALLSVSIFGILVMFHILKDNFKR